MIKNHCSVYSDSHCDNHCSNHCDNHGLFALYKEETPNTCWEYLFTGIRKMLLPRIRIWCFFVTREMSLWRHCDSHGTCYSERHITHYGTFPHFPQCVVDNVRFLNLFLCISTMPGFWSGFWPFPGTNSLAWRCLKCLRSPFSSRAIIRS